MRTPLKMLAAAGLSLGLLAAPASAAKPSGQNIVGLAVSLSESSPGAGDAGAFDGNHGDFDILVQGVLATGLADALSKPGQQTVFAPTDQAFLDLTGAASEAEAFDAVVALLGVDGTKSVIEYHVAPGKRTADKVVPATKIRTGGGFVTKDAGSTVLVDGQGRSVQIVGVDNMVSNGVVHVISSVLLP